MPEIVPAVLAEDEKEFAALLDIAQAFAPVIQLDFMDGDFVPSRSLSPERLPEITRLTVEAEAHLMMRKPEVYFEALKHAGVVRAIFHVEAVESVVDTIEKCKYSGLKAGIAFNPDTDVWEYIDEAREADEVLFMTVYPGFYGRPMVKEVLDTVRQFKRKYPEIRTAVDGGVKLDNVKTVAATGVDRICVGSAIMKAEKPAEAYQEFIRRVRHAGKT